MISQRKELQLQRRCQHIIWPFFPKLHQNEEMLGQRGARTPPLRSTTASSGADPHRTQSNDFVKIRSAPDIIVKNFLGGCVPKYACALSYFAFNEEGKFICSSVGLGACVKQIPAYSSRRETRGIFSPGG